MRGCLEVIFFHVQIFVELKQKRAAVVKKVATNARKKPFKTLGTTHDEDTLLFCARQILCDRAGY